MENYKKEFIQLALDHKVLQFGEFTLKSGRISPYFFNAGLFHSGQALAQLGRCYAQAIVSSKIPFDLIFGPAYKGIPIAASTSIALASFHDIDAPYCYNRKEVKNHGEGGVIVGAPLKGKTLIVDDVITAGTAIRESLSVFENTPATPAAILVGLDRQEKGNGHLSAIEELRAEIHVPIYSIIDFQDIIRWLKMEGIVETLKKAEVYRKQYGA